MKKTATLISILILSSFLLLFMPYQSLLQNKGTSEAEPSSSNNYYLKTAKLYFEQKDYARAKDALELAVLLEPNNEEAQALLNQSRQLLAEIDKPIGTPGKTGETKEAPAAYSEEISRHIQDAYTAIKEGRHDDAAKIVDLILASDPANKEALYIKEKINDINHKHTTENLKTLHAQEKLKNSAYLKEASIPYQDNLRFPRKEQWEDISKRTLPELDRIVEENKIKTEQLRLIPNPLDVSFPKVIEDALNTIISIEFLDTQLKDVVVFIREKTNINMIIDADAGSAPVTLKLKDVSLRTALRYILPKGYEYVVEGDIIHIYKQRMELRVYDVRDILINLDDKEPLKFDITAAATSQLSLSKGEAVKAKDPSERVLDLIELIATTVEPSSWSSRASIIGASSGGTRQLNISGQGEGSIIARMGQPGDLVVVNTQHVHKQIEDLLASLRSSQNLQVSIEARFISVTDKFLEDIGSNISKFFSDKTSINTGADTDISDLVSGDGLQINYSILNGSMLKGFLRAIQESKDSEILTTPRITLSNTQRGNIAVVKTINYIQSTSVSEGVVTPVIGTIPQGTTFDVRPIVSADRKYIYLEVTPSVFEVEEITSFTFSGLSTDATVGGGGSGSSITVPPEQTVQLPKVNVSQVSVTVCVPDKGTLMIGGLGQITKDTLTTGIPILSKIPILKRLFSRDQKSNKKSNLIILLKPTIIIKEEQEANFLSMSKKLDKADANNNKKN